ncbi:hypothetical protein GYH30_007041 [Glycine max]|nr:hypothetical protein GYH30_007041 [Glycine max]
MGEFSVAIAYKLIAYHHTAEADDVWKRIWILHVPKWSNKDPACYHCNVSIESIVHVHRDCPLAMDRSDFFGSVTSFAGRLVCSEYRWGSERAPGYCRLWRLIRDCDGQWKGGFAKCIGRAFVFMAELWGVWVGLNLAHQTEYCLAG